MKLTNLKRRGMALVMLLALTAGLSIFLPLFRSQGLCGPPFLSGIYCPYRGSG